MDHIKNVYEQYMKIRQKVKDYNSNVIFTSWTQLCPNIKPRLLFFISLLSFFFSFHKNMCIDSLIKNYSLFYFFECLDSDFLFMLFFLQNKKLYKKLKIISKTIQLEYNIVSFKWNFPYPPRKSLCVHNYITDGSFVCCCWTKITRIINI